MVTRQKNMETGVLISLVLIYANVQLHMPATLFFVSVLLVTLLYPMALSPITWCWFTLGEKISWLMSTVLLTGVFYLLVTPVAMVRRMAKIDKLKIHSFKKGRQSVFCVVDKTYDARYFTKQY